MWLSLFIHALKSTFVQLMHMSKRGCRYRIHICVATHRVIYKDNIDGDNGDENSDNNNKNNDNNDDNDDNNNSDDYDNNDKIPPLILIMTVMMIRIMI